MDKNDKQNLEFLLTVDLKTLVDWYNNTSIDDHNYAIELLSEYSKELTEICNEQLVEQSLDNMSVFPEANQVINQVLKKIK